MLHRVRWGNNRDWYVSRMLEEMVVVCFKVLYRYSSVESKGTNSPHHSSGVPIAAARVRSQLRACGIYGGQSCIGT
jgi:hypothetical protein